MSASRRLGPRWLPDRLRPQPGPRGRRRRRPVRRGRRRTPSRRPRGSRHRHRGHPRRQRLRPAVHRTGPARRRCRPRSTRPLGRARLAPRGRLRVGRRWPSWPPWPSSRPAATTSPWCSASSSRRRSAATLGAQYLGAAAWVGHEGEERHVHVAAHVQRARRRVRPALRPGRRPPARHRRAQRRATPGATPTRRPAAGTSRPGRASSDDDAANPVVEGRIRRYRLQRRSPTAPPGSCWSPTPTCATTRTARPAGADPRLGPPHRRASACEQKLDTRPRRALRPAPRAPGDHRRLRPGAASPTRRPRRHRDARLLHHERVHRDRPLRDHRPGRVLEGGRGRRRSRCGGRLPVNPSGGLIGGGHPVGATGVRMLLDASKQVTGTGRRLPGRGRQDLRHAQLRRQHHHDRAASSSAPSPTDRD